VVNQRGAAFERAAPREILAAPATNRSAGAEFERARTAGVTDAQLVEVAAHVASVTVDMPAQPNLPKA